MNIDFSLILLVLVAGSGLIWLFDRMWFAPRRRKVLDESRQDDEPVVVEYARSFFPIFLVIFVLRAFFVEPFQIPSASMVPTLQIGDYILVNKYTYGVRLPVVRTKVLDWGEPKRGDVMVFYPPHKNNQYFIKRVVGLPGDVVTYRNKQLYVNNEPVSTEELAVIPEGRISYQLSLEQLGDTKHLIQTAINKPSGDFSVVVKPGHYFMMGDNRDNSLDSRAWGQVSERDIVGKAFAIWMHWDSLFSIPSFDRAGGID